MKYTIHEHEHRFAAWAASRGASASKDYRFKTQDGRKWLEDAGLDAKLTLGKLPTTAAGMDRKHRNWREHIASKGKVSEGVAAKLINLYLKARFVHPGNLEHPAVAQLHPPLDWALLTKLREKRFFAKDKEAYRYAGKGWSTFDGAMYERIITALRGHLKEGQGLWEVEEYWDLSE